MADPPTGPTVFNDRYELHRKLARGGMADVYLAKDLLLDRQVAVKVLFPEYARDATFVERFRREAKAAANLNHPNIVAVYDWGEQLGTYFIVMEYVEGQPLSEIIHHGGAMEPARAAEITCDVADALAFAHRNGVVHRDIKPGNILITPLGQVKVADFGIAQAGASEATQASLTQVGAVMGTATYFSPEQAQGRPVDPRSDLYSLGCVLYEMLTGRQLFTGETPLAIAYKHVQEPPVPPRQYAPQVPPALEAIDLRLLAKDPDHRYASADDLLADLHRFSRGEPVAAAGIPGPDDPTRVVPVGVPVPPTLVGGEPAGALAGGNGAGGPGDGSGGEPEGKSNRGPWVAALIGLLVVLAIVLVVLALRLNQSSGDVTVPAVGDLTEQEATARLEQAGFRVEATRENNDSVDPGKVISQDPTGGSRAPEGSTVKISVSLGRGEVQVPDVLDMSESAARVAIERASLVPDVVQAPHPTTPAGRVIAQDPEGGTRAQKDSFVRITVSSGPETVVIPSVSGMSVSQATSRLQEAGFRVTQRSESSASVPSGSVAGTDPAAGESAPKGSTVTLIISSGPAPTTTTTPATTTTQATTTTTLPAQANDD